MRSEDEILALVREKADGLRRRRRHLIGASGGLAAALLLVSGVAVASLTGDSNEATVTADAGTDSTEPTTTTAVPSTTTSPTATDADASPTTTVPDEPAHDDGEESRPADAGTPPATSTPMSTTTTTAPPPPLCPASAIEMEVSTDRPAYQPGEEVVMTARGTNRAGHDCAEPDSSDTTIRDQEGRHVYGVASIAGRTEGDWRWRAGETRTSEERWTQEAFTEDGRSPVPPGTYTVTMSWSAADPESGDRVAYASSASFTIEDGR